MGVLISVVLEFLINVKWLLLYEMKYPQIISLNFLRKENNMKMNELPLEIFAWIACGEWLSQMKTLISSCSLKYNPSVLPVGKAWHLKFKPPIRVKANRHSYGLFWNDLHYSFWYPLRSLCVIKTYLRILFFSIFVKRAQACQHCDITWHNSYKRYTYVCLWICGEYGACIDILWAF